MKNKQQENEERWYIGIDFGTSNTCIVAYEEVKNKIYTNSSFLLTDTNSNIPTVIVGEGLLNSSNVIEEQYYVGQEANKRAFLRHFRGLKDAARQLTPDNGSFGSNLRPLSYPFEHIGLDSKIQFGNDDNSMIRSVRELLIRFFKEIFKDKEDINKLNINKNTIRKIVIGQPVVKGRKPGGCSEVSYEDTLKGLLAECFTGDKNDKDFIGTVKGKIKKDGKITVESEPALAGLAYLAVDTERENKKVLVIDIGGGTTDFSVLEYKNKKPDAINIGSCNLAGNAIDDVIFNLLPADIPRSKYLCRERKESLFSEKVSADIEEIIYKTNNGLCSDGNMVVFRQDDEYGKKIDMHYCKKISDNCIVLSTGERYENGQLVETTDKTIIKVFDDIGKALKDALTKNNISGINTVFFVGGSSVITPLRDKLIETAKPYCTNNYNIITMFGDDTKTIKAEWDRTLSITNYNAVAIGACIKAMGEHLLRIKPKVYCRRFYKDSEEKTDTTDKDLIIATEKGVPFAYVYYNEGKILLFKNREFNPFEKAYTTFRIGEEIKKYKISRNELNKTDSGLLVYALFTKKGIIYKACSFDKDPKGIIDDEKLAELIEQAVEIKMELIV